MRAPDARTREALEAALEAFPGTVLLVSHDRALVDAVAERTLAIEDGTVRSYDGGWADYIRQRNERAQREAPPPPEQPAKKLPPKRTAAAPKREPSELELVESAIATQEQAIAALERQLAEDWADVETLAAHRQARDELKALLARWEQLFEREHA